MLIPHRNGVACPVWSKLMSHAYFMYNYVLGWVLRILYLYQESVCFVSTQDQISSRPYVAHSMRDDGGKRCKLKSPIQRN